MLEFSQTKWRRNWELAALIVICCGCVQNEVKVSGEVTYQGKPVDSGSISFIPADGVGPSRGTTITDGKFLLVGDEAPTPGKKMVKIMAAMKTGRQVQAGPPSPPGEMIDEANYINAQSLEADISDSDSQNLTFEIQPAKKR